MKRVKEAKEIHLFFRLPFIGLMDELRAGELMGLG